MHEVLVNRLGGLSLPRKSVVRLTDRPDMTLDVYRGRKTTIQQQQQLISHSSKVMLKVILNRLKPQAKEIIAEEQAGFRAGRGTTEQIFNLRILCEKYLQHQKNLYHVFIDFKKAFDRVWQAALWATMRKYNISANLVRTIEQLYDKATSAVQMNDSIGEWLRTKVGVRQGCSLVTDPLQYFSRTDHV